MFALRWVSEVQATHKCKVWRDTEQEESKRQQQQQKKLCVCFFLSYESVWTNNQETDIILHSAQSVIYFTLYNSIRKGKNYPRSMHCHAFHMGIMRVTHSIYSILVWRCCCTDFFLSSLVHQSALFGFLWIFSLPLIRWSLHFVCPLV